MKKLIVCSAMMATVAAFAGLLYEPSCYVAQGNLILNLDGIRNVGALKG